MVCVAYMDVQLYQNQQNWAHHHVLGLGTDAYVPRQLRGREPSECCGGADSPLLLYCGGRRQKALRAQYRFLPALRHLWRSVAEPSQSVKWLGLVDDDSIVNPNHLFALLTKLAPEQRFGRPGGAKLAPERRFVKNSVFP